MNDYWKIAIGLAVILPSVYLFLILVLSGAGL